MVSNRRKQNKSIKDKSLKIKNLRNKSITNKENNNRNVQSNKIQGRNVQSSSTKSRSAQSSTQSRSAQSSSMQSQRRQKNKIQNQNIQKNILQNQNGQKTTRIKNTDKCPYAEKCGGCEYQGMSYKEQLDIKQKMVEKNVGRFCKVLPIIGMENPYHYRNKVHAVFDMAGKRGSSQRGGDKTASGIISGIYKAGTHEVVNIDSCCIEDEISSSIIRDIRGILASFKIRIFDEDTGCGLFRHVLVRRGFYSGEVMVVLVLSSPVMPSKKNFVKELLRLHPEITTIILNVNNKKTSMVLGERQEVIYGKGYIEDTLCGCTFRISPKSFYQVNPVQTEMLYGKAIEYAALSGKERVIDAYCGTGTIGLIAAAKAGEVIGVELNKDAVRDAVLNAKCNNIDNAVFHNADAGQFMVKMAQQNSSADVVLMDPPRAGSDEAFLSSVVKLSPKRVVYVSCNPETLARDLAYLTKHGYRALECQPVDMFPWTGSIETVCLLSKLHEAKHHVSVKLDMDEMDLIAEESKATYEEIKKYVAEHNDGMKVTNLYIAQVKKKCGITERENYNKPKSEDEMQPQCPKDKETAIEDALRYFQMK